MASEYVSMQETGLDKGVREIAHHSWWKRLLIGALVGGFFGALDIWFYEFSLNRLMAAILSGASFFAIVGLLAVKFAKDRSKVIVLGGFAGFVAGIAYWVVARPSSSPLMAVGIGLVGGIVYAGAAWAESKD
jgi:drug/metabolite transporter (DMT)-like permease